MQPPADQSGADHTTSVDGLKSNANFRGSGKVIQPSPGFDPNAPKPPKIVDPEAADEATETPVAPEPPVPADPPTAPTPPASPQPPTPPTGPGGAMPGSVFGEGSPPPPPAPAVPPPSNSTPPSDEYISNPFKLFGPSWRALKLNFGSLVVGVLAYFGAFLAAGVAGGVFALIGSIVGGSARTALIPIGFLIGAILLIWLMVRVFAAFVVLVLASARGTKMSFGEAMKAGKPYGWRLIGYTILYALMVIVGYILLLVPGFLFQTWFAFGYYLIVDENLGVFAAFSRSKQLVHEHFWESYGPMAVMYVFGIIGIIPILGWIVEFILYVAYGMALPTRYVMLKSYKDSGTTFPPHSKVNVILPVVGVLAMVATLAFAGYSFVHNLHNLNYSSGTGMSTNRFSY